MNEQLVLAVDYVVKELEQAGKERGLSEHLRADALEVIADTRGRLEFVLTTGGPHVALTLGDGFPRVLGHWGPDTWSAQADIEASEVEETFEKFWRITMERAFKPSASIHFDRD